MLQSLSAGEVDLLLRICDRLSRTLDQTELRKRVCEDLLALLRADFAASYVWCDERRVFENAVFVNMSPDNLAQYEAHYQFNDPITPALQKRRRATLVTEILPQAELEKTEFFNDFLMRDGLHHGVNLYVYDGHLNIGDLRIWRAKGRPDLDRREVDLLEAVSPHFRNALRNARIHATVASEAGMWGELWDNAHAASFLFDEAGRLVHRNRAAEAIEERLPPKAFAAFLAHLRALAAGDLSRTEWGPYHLSVLRSTAGNAGRPMTAVQAYRDKPVRIDARWLTDTHGLTGREAEVCFLVVKGLTDSEIGSALDIAPSTVHTHLKSVFRKLGIGTRTELVHTLLEGLLDIRL